MLLNNSNRTGAHSASVLCSSNTTTRSRTSRYKRITDGSQKKV